MKIYNARFLSDDELSALPFAAIGEDVMIDSSVRLIGIENISLGSHVRIDAGTIIVATGPVAIGSRVHIAANCYLEGKSGIRIADFVGLSGFVSLYSVSDDYSGASLTNPMTPERFKVIQSGQIVLERHAIVGTKATVLPGVIIGEGAAVSAHALVVKHVPPWTIYGGTPARYIKQRKRDLLEFERALVKDEQA
jgi:acetyltransferase-like isoleucine patch superfamily enzyme